MHTRRGVQSNPFGSPRVGRTLTIAHNNVYTPIRSGDAGLAYALQTTDSQPSADRGVSDTIVGPAHEAGREARFPLKPGWCGRLFGRSRLKWHLHRNTRPNPLRSV